MNLPPLPPPPNTASSSFVWNSQLDVALESKTVPVWSVSYIEAVDQLVIWNPQRFYVTTNSGFRTLALSAVVQFNGFAIDDTLLYLLDGPVLLKWDLSSIDPTQPPDGPDIAINTLQRGSQAFRRGATSWESAAPGVYATPGTPALPGFAAPVVIPNADGVTVFVLSSDGNVRGLDSSFSTWAVGRHNSPDQLVARLETVGSKTYLCYPAGNDVITLDTSSDVLRVAEVQLPQRDTLTNAVGWVRVRNANDAGQMSVTLMGYQQRGTFIFRESLMCFAAPDQAETYTLIDVGGAGFPQLGYGGRIINAPPSAVQSSTFTLMPTLMNVAGTGLEGSGPPFLRLEGQSVSAYFAFGGYMSNVYLQKWQFPPLAADAGLTQTWQQMNTAGGLPLMMGSLIANLGIPWDPAPAYGPLVWGGLAATCAAYGLSGSLADYPYDVI